MATKKTELRSYYTKLAQLDEQRQSLLREIKSHPTYAVAAVKEAFAVKAGTWFVRDNGEGKAMSVSEANADRVIRFVPDSIIVNQSNVNPGGRQTAAIRKIKSTIYQVTMTVEDLTGGTYQVTQTVSLDRPLVAQLFQSVHELTPLQLKKVKKKLADLEATKAKTAQIRQLEETIAKAQDELKKLRSGK